MATTRRSTSETPYGTNLEELYDEKFGAGAYAELERKRAEGGEGGGSGGSGGGMFDPGQIGYGFFPANLLDFFPDPKTIRYKNIPGVTLGDPERYSPDYQFTDPIEFAKAFGDFNRGELRSAFDLAKDMSLEQLDLELKGLESFVPGASALKRSEVNLDNIFNQAQRLRQLEQVMPEARGQLAGQASRAEAFAEGRVPDSIQDRALEVGVRSSAADLATAGGFGAGGGAGRKLSDLMSVDRRLQLSQYGDSLLSQNINQKAGLYLSPTQYSDAGAQVKVTPEIGAGRLASQNLSEIRQATMVDPNTALTSTIQQRQFDTSMEARASEFNITNQLGVDKFNAQTEFDRQRYNATNRLNTRMFNASNINQFRLGKFQYMVGYAGTVAGAAQTDLNTQVAIEQQKRYEEIFGDYMDQAQSSSFMQSIAGLFSMFIPFLLNQLMPEPQKPNTTPTTTPTTTTPSTQTPSTPTTDSTGTPTPPAEIPEADRDEPDPITPGDVPGLPDTGGGSDVDTDSFAMKSSVAPIENFKTDLGLTNVPASNPGTVRALTRTAQSTLNSAGVFNQDFPNSDFIGYDNASQPMYAPVHLARSNNINEGSKNVQSLGEVLAPLNALSKNDAKNLSNISQTVSSPRVLSSLTEARNNNNPKKFVNELVGKKNSNIEDNYAAYTLYKNWDSLSPAQKSLGAASVKLQNFRYEDGKKLGEKTLKQPVVKGNKVIVPELKVGDALDLLSKGVNVYSLSKNWDQINTIRMITGNAPNAESMAQIGTQFGLLGTGTSGSAVPVSLKELDSSKLKSAPQFGVGAVIGNRQSKIPKGYVKVKDTGSQFIAMPSFNVPTTAVSQRRI